MWIWVNNHTIFVLINIFLLIWSCHDKQTPAALLWGGLKKNHTHSCLFKYSCGNSFNMHMAIKKSLKSATQTRDSSRRGEKKKKTSPGFWIIQQQLQLSVFYTWREGGMLNWVQKTEAVWKSNNKFSASLLFIFFPSIGLTFIISTSMILHILCMLWASPVIFLQSR